MTQSHVKMFEELRFIRGELLGLHHWDCFGGYMSASGDIQIKQWLGQMQFATNMAATTMHESCLWCLCYS